MPNGGKVQVSCIEKGKYIHLSITDNGLGISAKDQKKLFTPLFSTKTTGIGLGLAVSMKFIEANGGKITVKSKPGQGSTFTIIIPSAG
jgi:two-component system sensor histidine kinase HydH